MRDWLISFPLLFPSSRDHLCFEAGLIFVVLSSWAYSQISVSARVENHIGDRQIESPVQPVNKELEQHKVQMETIQ